MRLIDADNYCDNICLSNKKNCNKNLCPLHRAPTIDAVPQWISAKERMPEMIPCNAGTAYSEAVAVLTKSRNVCAAFWNGKCWIGDFEFWGDDSDDVTHWMSVLPLPETPKEEEDATDRR